jgi:flagella basal body P-ring formation protein FlgA
MLTLAGGSVLGRAPDRSPASANPPSRGLLHINVRPAANAQGPCVLLKDVAELSSGDADLWARVADLDLIDAPPTGKSTTILVAAIAFRLQLAGIDRRAFHLEGADRVVVGPAGPRVTGEDLVAAARDHLLHHLPWPADDVRIEVVQPPQLPALDVRRDDRLRLQANVRSSGSSMVGRVVVDVAVLVNDQKRAVVPVSLDVHLQQQLAMTSRRSEAGEVLSKENLIPERRLVRGVNPYLTFAECAAGRRAKRAIPAGQLLAPCDVEAEAAGRFLVKQHDLVKLTAKVGAMRVTALGEALQDGGAGQSIRVRNVDSKNVILGRVVDRSLVEVDY